MPLNIEVETEHPDVVALKKRVIEVTDAYTSRHGWCGEARNALREAGVLDSPNNKVAVAIRFTLPGSEEQTAVKVFNASDLVGKSDDEQKAWVAEQITPAVKVAGVNVPIPVTIVDLSNSEANPSGYSDGLNYPAGYQHFYTSNEGRVAHLTSIDRLDQRAQRAIDREESAHRVESQMRNVYVYALCGASAAYGAKLTSVRSEHRVCAKCLTRAGT